MNQPSTPNENRADLEVRAPVASGTATSEAEAQEQSDQRHALAFFEAMTPRFRGGIVENCAAAPMGKGHKNDGQPFNIETACYLKPVFAGIEKDSTRKVVIKAGVKTMKTFVMEAAGAFYVCHGIGDCTIYMATGDQADQHAKSRLLDWYYNIPSFQEKLRTVSDPRTDETTTMITFPEKTLFILPANLPSTQNINLCFVGISDAFLTEKSGMIDQAWARTTQYPDDKKFIVESQGGEEGFDFDRHYDDTDQGELHVTCPMCGTSQIFNWKAWHRVRPDDFAAVPPRDKVLEILAKYGCESQLEAVMGAMRCLRTATSPAATTN